MADNHKNFAYSTVATAPAPPDSGLSLVVEAGHGARFPSTPFNATIWPIGELPLASNSELVRVTNVSTDTLTIVREQEGSSARTVLVGDQIAATITALWLNTIGGYLDQGVKVADSPRFGGVYVGSNGEVRFYDNGNYVGFEAPALAGNQIWVLPDADGTIGQVLGTDGAGNLGWGTDGMTQPRARVYLSDDQLNIGDNVWTKVLLDTKTYDVGNNFTSNKFTVPTGGDGLYAIYVQWRGVNSLVDKSHSVAIYKNGAVASYGQAPTGAKELTALRITSHYDEIELVAGEYI